MKDNRIQKALNLIGELLEELHDIKGRAWVGENEDVLICLECKCKVWEEKHDKNCKTGKIEQLEEIAQSFEEYK